MAERSIARSVLELIGHTPLVRLNRLPKPEGAMVVRFVHEYLALT